MAEWKKVIVSGSNAELAQVTASGGINATLLTDGTTDHVVLVQDGNGNIKTIAQASVAGADNNTTYTGSGAIALAANNTFSFDPNQLTNMSGTAMVAADEFMVIDNTTGKRKPASEIGLDIFSNTTSGFITSYTNTTYDAGNGLTLGGTSNITFSVDLDGGTLNSDTNGLSVASNSIEATQLNVSGNGSNGDFLESDGDGTFSWTTVQVTDTTYGQGTGITMNGTVISSSTNQSHVTTVGALDTGSITSGFGSIDVGSSNIKSTGIISGSTVNALTANISNLRVTGSAQMSGNLIFNGVSFTETAVSTTSGSHVWGTGDNANTHVFTGSISSTGNITSAGTISGSAATFNTLSVGGTDINTLISTEVGANIDTVGTITSGIWNGDTIDVANGGTNAISFADKSVIVSQDSGTDTLSAKAMTANGSLLIGGVSGPEVGALSSAGGITITPGDGTIQISSTDTQLTQEQVEDFVGGMLDGTETGIQVGYDDTNGNLNFVVGGLTLTQMAGAFVQTAAEINAGSISDNDITILTTGAIIDYVATQTAGLDGDTTYTAGNDIDLTGDGTVISIESSLNQVSSIYNTDLKLGYAPEYATIDFSTYNHIIFDIEGDEKMRIAPAGIDVTGNITASGTLTIGGEVIIGGNLTVNGTTTTVNTETINLADNFIVLNSDIGSGVTPVDAGITINGGNVSDQSLYYDFNTANWGVYKGSGVDATTATANLVTVKAVGSAPTTGVPLYGNDANNQKGQMVVHGSDIYICVG